MRHSDHWYRFLVVAGTLALAVVYSAASAAANDIGVVVIHGKWGNPGGNMTSIISALRDAGMQVSTPEMPWSGRRLYDVPVEKADEQVDGEIAGLRERGAKKIFLLGQSLGSAYAIHFATRASVTGIVAIAPAHRTEVGMMRQSMTGEVQKAREYIAAGKADEQIGFTDLNQGKRQYLRVAAGPFLSYFDPEGAFNMARNVASLKPDVPVLWLVPTGEIASARAGVVALYERLPKNPDTRLSEPSADHFAAPTVAAPLAVQWIREVAAKN